MLRLLSPDLVDAHVACKQLGYARVSKGQTSEAIFINNFCGLKSQDFSPQNQFPSQILIHEHKTLTVFGKGTIVEDFRNYILPAWAEFQYLCQNVVELID